MGPHFPVQCVTLGTVRKISFTLTKSAKDSSLTVLPSIRIRIQNIFPSRKIPNVDFLNQEFKKIAKEFVECVSNHSLNPQPICNIYLKTACFKGHILPQ